VRRREHQLPPREHSDGDVGQANPSFGTASPHLSLSLSLARSSALTHARADENGSDVSPRWGRAHRKLSVETIVGKKVHSSFLMPLGLCCSVWPAPVRETDLLLVGRRCISF
jgi:hypothetical protein